MKLRIDFYKDSRKTRILKSLYLLPAAFIVYPFVGAVNGFLGGLFEWYNDCSAAWRK